MSRREPADDEPFAALAFKIQRDPQAGRLTYFRVYSGALTAGDRRVTICRESITASAEKVEGKFIRADRRLGPFSGRFLH